MEMIHKVRGFGMNSVELIYIREYIIWEGEDSGYSMKKGKEVEPMILGNKGFYKSKQRLDTVHGLLRNWANLLSFCSFYI